MSHKKEGRYYVEYLGWKEVGGLHGRQYTDSLSRRLFEQRNASREVLPRMTIKLNPLEMLITQEVANGSRIQRKKYPSIPTEDVTFVAQSDSPDADVVSVIFLGYNPHTQSAAHAHVYRFDSIKTASMFTQHLSAIIDNAQYKHRISVIEKDLQETIKGQQDIKKLDENDNNRQLKGKPQSMMPEKMGVGSGYTYPSAEEALRQRPDIHIVKSSQPEPERQRGFSNLRQELEHKLHTRDAPILLPPKDYDTVVRRHGHLSIRNKIKPKGRSIVGADSVFSRMEPAHETGNSSDQSDQSESSERGSETSHERPSQHKSAHAADQRDGPASKSTDFAMWAPQYSLHLGERRGSDLEQGSKQIYF